MTGRTGAMAVALAVGAFAAGCGGGGGKAEEGERAVAPRRAIAELGEVRRGLAAALVTYRSGDRAAADEQVGDAYLEHFELVEGPLDAADHELKEALEDGIRERLRGQLEAGVPAAQAARLVAQLDAKLDRAAATLRRRDASQ